MSSPVAPRPMTHAVRPDIRRATSDDELAVRALLERARLESAFVAPEFRVAVLDGTVVACARLKPLAGGARELASVAVREDQRGRGVGEALVRATLRDVEGEVLALALAPGFFERVGFVALDAMPPSLAEKAAGACASRAFVPMARVGEVRAYYERVARERRGPMAREGAGDYAAEDLASLPEGAYLGLGAGNPVAAAALAPGESVVDLGCGAGADALLAARAIGPSGRVVGVDSARGMVERARRVAQGRANVSFVEARMDATGLPDASADVVLSNGAVNLAPDKDAVLREAARLLRPGGRLVVADTLRAASRAPGAPTCDCEGGALSLDEWREALSRAGFVDADVAQTRAPGAGTGNVLARARRS